MLIEEPGWLRGALELALSLRGDALTVTDDPRAALERVRAGDVDLAIVGLFPSGVHHAVELCRALRQAAPGRMPSVVPQVIACVPSADPSRIGAALDAGATGYLSVPVDAGQLRARITQAEQIARELEALAPATQPPDRPVDGIVGETPAPVAGQVHPGALVERSLDPLLVIAPDGMIRYATPAAESLLGQPPERLIGRSIYTFCHPDDAARALELVNTALTEPARPLAADLRVVHCDGSARDVEARVGNLLDTPGVGGIVLALRDITERKRIEAQLERQALYDSLTRLPNRTLFMDYLEHALARADRRLDTVVVMFFDLDNFKLVNDTFGHAFGDAVLAKVGERLHQALRASDTAARWGGDEFTALLEDIASEQDAIAVAERVSRSLSAPYRIDDREVYVSVSIGIAFSTPGESRPGDLLRHADVALYRAKAEGKRRWVIFERPDRQLDQQPAAVARETPVDRQPAPPPPEAPAPPSTPPATAPPTDDTLRLLMARISALEREAGRLEAELQEERRREG